MVGSPNRRAKRAPLHEKYEREQVQRIEREKQNEILQNENENQEIEIPALKKLSQEVHQLIGLLPLERSKDIITIINEARSQLSALIDDSTLDRSMDAIDPTLINISSSSPSNLDDINSPVDASPSSNTSSSPSSSSSSSTISSKFAKNNNLRFGIISTYHQCKWDEGNQNNFTNTLNTISEFFHWTGMEQDIKQFIEKQCPTCVYKLPIATEAFDSIYIGLVRRLKLSGDFRSVLVVVDRHTNFTFILPCPKTQTCDDITHLLMEDVVPLVGLPKSIVLHSSSFLSKQKNWKDFGSKHSIDFHFSRGFFPPDYRTTVNKLKHFCCGDGPWHETIRVAALKLNTNSENGPSAFERLFKIKPPQLEFDLTESNCDLLFPWACTFQAFGSSQPGGYEEEGPEGDEDRGPFVVGDQVLVRTKHFRDQNCHVDFQGNWAGPFAVLRADPRSGMYWIELPDTMSRHSFVHQNSLSKFHKNMVPHEGEVSTSKIDVYSKNPNDIINITSMDEAEADPY